MELGQSGMTVSGICGRFRVNFATQILVDLLGASTNGNDSNDRVNKVGR